MTLWLLATGYLFGSIPFAYLVAHRYGQVDLRREGSGNVGAANVLRTTRVRLAVLVIALDVAKGAAAVGAWMAAGVDTPGLVATGLAAIVGHVYPVWLGLRGGKGVATACGVFAMLAPGATALAVVVFVAGIWLTRYVSVGSVSAIVLLAPLAFVTRRDESVVMGAILAGVLVLFRHRANLARLLAGTERRIGQRA